MNGEARTDASADPVPRRAPAQTAPVSSRREFLGRLATAGWTLSFAGCATDGRRVGVGPALRLGVIADLHHGFEPTALHRLEAFMQAVDARQPDTIVQLGDFNYGKPESRECQDLWNQFRGPKLHVLGNHDMDFQTKERILGFWGMRSRYYSFEQGGLHFVVLDRNNLKVGADFIPYAKGNFYRRIEEVNWLDPEQSEWLRADLAAARLPVVVFVHQAVGIDYAFAPPLENRLAIERILEGARDEQGRNKVVVCFCGHEHLDRYALKGGVHYVWINSASYSWLSGKDGGRAPYRDPLFCFVTFDVARKVITVEGRRSDWVKPTPAERGYPQAAILSASISDRRLRLNRVVEGF